MCAVPRQPHANRQQLLAPLTTTCISASPTGDKPWYLFRGKFAAILHLNLLLWVTNEGREAIKAISGAVAGESKEVQVRES